MNLLVFLLIVLVAFAALDTIAAFVLFRVSRAAEPRILTLTERAFVQVCIAFSALLVAVPSAFAIPAAFHGDIDPGLTTWLLLASLIVKSLPTVYWTYLYITNR